jgi:hypothetical protein
MLTPRRSLAELIAFFIASTLVCVVALIALHETDRVSWAMMSPTLGDFIEMRFVDLGPRLGQASQHVAAVARIAREFTRPGGGAGGNYFALAIVDWSAVVVKAGSSSGVCQFRGARTRIGW